MIRIFFFCIVFHYILLRSTHLVCRRLLWTFWTNIFSCPGLLMRLIVYNVFILNSLNRFSSSVLLLLLDVYNLKVIVSTYNFMFWVLINCILFQSLILFKIFFFVKSNLFAAWFSWAFAICGVVVLLPHFLLRLSVFDFFFSLLYSSLILVDLLELILFKICLSSCLSIKYFLFNALCPLISIFSSFLFRWFCSGFQFLNLLFRLLSFFSCVLGIVYIGLDNFMLLLHLLFDCPYLFGSIKDITNIIPSNANCSWKHWPLKRSWNRIWCYSFFVSLYTFLSLFTLQIAHLILVIKT